MVKKKASVYYIDNKRFYQEIKDYIHLCREADERGDIKPIIPNYIGECFYKIATKLANRPNFSSYSYKDEMIGDAIENSVNYVSTFDPDRGSNPFAFFTQTAWNAFVARINKEKKQQYVKYKGMEHMIIHNNNFSAQVSDVPHALSSEFYENTQKFIASYEEGIENAKLKKEAKLQEKRGLENFIEDV